MINAGNTTAFVCIEWDSRYQNVAVTGAVKCGKDWALWDCRCSCGNARYGWVAAFIAPIDWVWREYRWIRWRSSRPRGASFLLRECGGSRWRTGDGGGWNAGCRVFMAAINCFGQGRRSPGWPYPISGGGGHIDARAGGRRTRARRVLENPSPPAAAGGVAVQWVRPAWLWPPKQESLDWRFGLILLPLALSLVWRRLRPQPSGRRHPVADRSGLNFGRRLF